MWGGEGWERGEGRWKGSEDATLFRGFISGEIKNPAQGHRRSICFADSALGSPSMPVNINQARHLNATGPTSRGQQIFNMRLRPQRSHLSLEIEENIRALYVQYGFTEAGLMWLRIYRMPCVTVRLFIIPTARLGCSFFFFFCKKKEKKKSTVLFNKTLHIKRKLRGRKSSAQEGERKMPFYLIIVLSDGASYCISATKGRRPKQSCQLSHKRCIRISQSAGPLLWG